METQGIPAFRYQVEKGHRDGKPSSFLSMEMCMQLGHILLSAMYDREPWLIVQSFVKMCGIRRGYGGGIEERS